MSSHTPLEPGCGDRCRPFLAIPSPIHHDSPPLDDQLIHPAAITRRLDTSTPRPEDIVMSTHLKAAVALTALALASVAVTRNAQACGVGDLNAWTNTHWSLPQTGNLANANAAAGASQQAPSAYINPLQLQQPVTGLYQFTFTAKGDVGIPDGTVLDHGFALWHADGTEMINSGKAPMSQSFCMGIWAQTGPRTYSINHFALNWDPTGTIFLGPVNILENIKLDPSYNSYSGSFTLNQYSPDGNTLLGSVQGIVTATRVTMNTH
jgi:hypothetical protein